MFSSAMSSEALKHVMSAEDEVKAIAFSKYYMNLIVKDIFTGRLTKLGLAGSPVEQASWDSQKDEATAYTLDSTVATPVLDVLASAKSITVAKLVDKINTNVTDYNVKLATLLGAQQKVLDTITACATNDDCIVVKEELFGVMMPTKLAAARGLLTQIEIDADNNRNVEDSKYGIQF